MPYSVGQKIEKKIESPEKTEKIKPSEPREPKEKKYKMVLTVNDRDTLNDAKNWIEKISHYPIFQNWKTRNTSNPTWKPDGRIGQELAKKLEKILAETS